MMVNGFKNKKIFSIKRKEGKNVIWTQYEDELLLSMEKKFGSKWRFIAFILNNKTKRECFSRFSKLNPMFKKGKFTKEEDEKILNLVDIYGKKWRIISRFLISRTSKQIRSRYVNYLDKNLDRSDITEIEICLIKENFMRYGNDYCKYIKLLPKLRSCRFIRKYINSQIIPFL